MRQTSTSKTKDRNVKKIFATVLAAASLTACVSDQSIRQVQIGDDKKSCSQLQSELEQLGIQFEDAKDDSGVTGKNVGMAIVFWPGIIYNEVKASGNQSSVENRIQYLTSLYNSKCLEQKDEQPRGQSLTEKLKELKQLLDDGLITKEQHDQARQKAIDSV